MTCLLKSSCETRAALARKKQVAGLLPHAIAPKPNDPNVRSENGQTQLAQHKNTRQPPGLEPLLLGRGAHMLAQGLGNHSKRWPWTNQQHAKNAPREARTPDLEVNSLTL